MLRLVFKRNDKLCAPGKEAITIRDGMLVDWHRESGEHAYWPTLSKREKEAFFYLEVDDTPGNIAMARAACEPKDVYLQDGKLDLVNSRARSKRVDFKALETTLMLPGLDATTQTAAELEPTKFAKLDLATVLGDTTVLAAVRTDVKAITTGPCTVGSGGGDTYST